MVAHADDLIRSHVGLVGHVARRMSRRLPQHVGFEELRSAGMIGLVTAARRYDPERGVTFASYSYPRIRGAMLDELRSLDWVKRTARGRSGFKPTMTEFSAIWDEEPPVFTGEPDPAVKAELSDLFRWALASVGPVERFVLTLYYRDGLSGRAIGSILQLSEGRISQVRTRAERQLRALAASA